QDSGYTVLAAGNGPEAIDLSNRHGGPIHLLLTDAVMPGMNGRALAERLVIHRQEIRVLYVSGYTDDTVLRNGLLGRDMAFLQKPFTRDALLRKVRTVLEGGERRTHAHQPNR
ncbi:MAG: response regulator, partial [Terriglobia bacterium]